MRASMRRRSRRSRGAERDEEDEEDAQQRRGEEGRGEGAAAAASAAAGAAAHAEGGEEDAETVEAEEQEWPDSRPASQRLSLRLGRGLGRTRRWLLGQARANEAAVMEVSRRCLSVAAIRDIWEAVENESLAPRKKLCLVPESGMSVCVVRSGTKRSVNTAGAYEPRGINMFRFNAGSTNIVRGTNPRFPRKVFTHDSSDLTELARTSWRVRDVVDHALVPLEIESGLPTVERLKDGASGPDSSAILVLASTDLKFAAFRDALLRCCERNSLDPAEVFVWHLELCVHHTSTGLPKGQHSDTGRAKRFFKEEFPEVVEQFDQVVVVLDERLEGLRQAEVVYSLYMAGEKGRDVELIWPGQNVSDFLVVANLLDNPYSWISVYLGPSMELGLPFDGFVLAFWSGEPFFSELVHELDEDVKATLRSINKHVQAVLRSSMSASLSDFVETCMQEKSLENARRLLDTVRFFSAIENYELAIDLGERTLEVTREGAISEEAEDADENSDFLWSFSLGEAEVLMAIADALVMQSEREAAAVRLEEALTVARERRPRDFRLHGQVVLKASCNLREIDGRREDGIQLAEAFVEEALEKAEVSVARDATMPVLEDMGADMTRRGEFTRGVRPWLTLKKICVDFSNEVGDEDYALLSIRFFLLAAMTEASACADLRAEAEEQHELTNPDEWGIGLSSSFNLASVLMSGARLPNYSLQLFDSIDSPSFWERLMRPSCAAWMARTLLVLGRVREAARTVELLEDATWSGLEQRSEDGWALSVDSAYRVGDTDEAIARGQAFIETKTPSDGVSDDDPMMSESLNRARATLLCIYVQTYDLKAARALFEAFETCARRMIKWMREVDGDSSHARERITKLDLLMWSFRGSIARCEGRLEKSLECFRKADELGRAMYGPQNLAHLNARYNVVHLLLNLGRTEEAREVFESIPRPDEEPHAYYHKNEPDEEPQRHNDADDAAVGDAAQDGRNGDEETDDAQNDDENEDSSHAAGNDDGEVVSGRMSSTSGAQGASDDTSSDYEGPVMCEPLDEESARLVGPWRLVALVEARLAFQRGDFDQYAETLRQLAEAQVEINGEAFMSVLTRQVHYAAALRHMDAFEEAKAVLTRALKVAQGMKSPDPSFMAELLIESARVHAELGEGRLAVKQSAEALLLIRERAPRSARYGDSLLSRAAALHAVGRIDEAKVVAEQGLDLLAEIYGSESEAAGMALFLLAEITKDETVATECLRVREVVHGPSHPFTKRASRFVDALAHAQETNKQ